MIWALACAEKPAEVVEDVCAGPDPRVVGVLMRLEYARAADGVSDGFDLDGLQGDEGCGIEDYVSPEGAEGIDNAFAMLIPTLETTEAQAVEGIIDSTVKSGDLLLMFEMASFDPGDDGSDACVDFAWLRGEGEVMLGTDGELLSGQTFDRSTVVEPAEVADLPLDGGTLVAQPIDFDLPITVFENELEFVLENAAIRVEVEEDGVYSGVFGGAVETSYLLEIAAIDDVDDALYDIVEGLLAYAADMDVDGDGVCESISVTFQFSAVRAFFYDE